jgi:hypothetical protein
MNIKIEITNDTKLLKLFHENYHNKLRNLIDSWRPYLLNNEPNVDALALPRFEFDKKLINSKTVYFGLLDLVSQGALKVSLSQLARFLYEHSNLSKNYQALYQQMKNYHQEWI